MATLPRPVNQQNELEPQDQDREGYVDGIGALARTTKAMEVLRTITVAAVHQDVRPLFLTPMYLQTALFRERNENLNGNEAAANFRFEEIIRKNIYYLSNLMRNYDTVMLQLIQRGVLRLDEKDLIDDVKYTCGDSTLKNLKLYSFLVKKDLKKFGIFKNVLQQTENQKSVDLLEAAITAAALRDTRRPANMVEHPRNVAAGRSGAGASPLPGPSRRKPAWTCKFCTFTNVTANNCCEMCSKTRIVGVSTPVSGSPSERRGGGVSCATCTFMNEQTAVKCAVCEVEL